MSNKNNILPSSVFDFTIFPVSETKKVVLDAKGRNHQKLMIVYLVENDPKVDLAFLTKVMSAVKIDLDQDAHLIELTGDQHLSFAEMRSFSEFEKMIVFGKMPKEFGIHLAISKYTPLVRDGLTFLFADSLQDIANDKVLKGTLWSALKQVFLPD